MGRPSLGRAVRDLRRQVEEAGGRTEVSHDGHLKVFDRRGRFVYKARVAGKQAGDESAMDRTIYRQVLRRVRGEEEG